MMIEDNDILFISNGDDFIPPTNSEKFEMDDGSNGAERINGTISGFRIGKMLGRGGFGEVRIGEHHLTGEQVALKFLRKAEIISMGAAERTTTEIQCLSALRHQHIIRLQQVLVTIRVFFFYCPFPSPFFWKSS
jgi:serine/threonine protein kinase